MIEREGYSFAIDVTYERLPSFCTHCRNIGHHITSCRWLHPAKDTHVIDKQKKSIVSEKQQVEKWKPKDNPNGIGSSRAFEAPVVNNDAADSTIPQPDAIPLQIQYDATIGQKEEVVDVSIPISQVDAHSNLQTDKEPSTMTFTYQNVDEEIHQEQLPSTSVHVLEEITETQEENEDVDTTAIPQSPFIDVMALEHTAHTQTRPHTTECN